MAGRALQRYGLFDMLSIAVTLGLLTALVLTGCRRARHTETPEMSAAETEAARLAERRTRTEATLDMLAEACDRYWSQYHVWPYPNPDYVGVGPKTLGSDDSFREVYRADVWAPEAYNVTYCWIMSRKRASGAFMNMGDECFQRAGKGLEGPDGRLLHRVVDGFGQVIHVDRPAQYYRILEYIRFTSAGADKRFGTDDDIERYMKR